MTFSMGLNGSRQSAFKLSVNRRRSAILYLQLQQKQLLLACNTVRYVRNDPSYMFQISCHVGLGTGGELGRVYKGT